MGFRRFVAQWWAAGVVVALGVVGALDMTGRLGPLWQWLRNASPESWSALGTFAAAFVALYIATSDRRDRRKERLVAEQTRANLVVVEIDRSQISNPGAPCLRVVVNNLGGPAILNVSIDELLIDNEPSLNNFNAWHSFLPYVALKSGKNAFVLEPGNEDMAIAMRGVTMPTTDEILFNPEKYGPTISDATPITALVRFTDADGRQWLKESATSQKGPTPAVPLND